MIAAVGRILAVRPEDAALTLNDDWLLLTRVQGKVHKHNTDEWCDKGYDKILPIEHSRREESSGTATD